MPVSQDWVDYVHNHLDPNADPIIFNGSFGHRDAAKQLITRLDAYESLGVKYVVAPPGTDPFIESSLPSSDTQQTGETTVKMDGSSSTTVSWLLSAQDAGRSAQAITVVIGTDDGRSDGVLTVQACTDRDVCSRGTANVQGAIDHAPIKIKLDAPLALSAANNPQRINVTLEYQRATSPLELWLMTTNASRSVQVDGKKVASAPSVALVYPAKAQAVASLVYSGADMSIYALPKGAAYFEDSSGACDLRFEERESLSVDCRAASQLLRREAFYPGWHARVDGRESTILRGNDMFQRLNIPKGKHTVVFDYYPTGSWLILAGFVLGCCLWMTGFWYEQKSRRRI